MFWCVGLLAQCLRHLQRLPFGGGQDIAAATFATIEEEVQGQFLGGLLDDQLDDQIKLLSDGWKYSESPVVRLYRDRASEVDRKEFEEREKAAATRMLQVSHEEFEASVHGDQARFLKWEQDEAVRLAEAGAHSRRFKDTLRTRGTTAVQEHLAKVTPCLAQLEVRGKARRPSSLCFAR